MSTSSLCVALAAAAACLLATAAGQGDICCCGQLLVAVPPPTRARVAEEMQHNHCRSSAAAENNAVKHGRYYYEFFSVPLNWWEARDVCRHRRTVAGQRFSYSGSPLSGDILWLGSTRESQWIQFMIESTWGSRQYQVWLSARRLQGACDLSDRWVWPVYPAVIPAPYGANPWIYYAWQPQPRCHYGQHEYCGAIRAEAIHWSDELCTKRSKFICKAWRSISASSSLSASAREENLGRSASASYARLDEDQRNGGGGSSSSSGSSGGGGSSRRASATFVG